jgi:hypothetical protein
MGKLFLFGGLAGLAIVFPWLLLVYAVLIGWVLLSD